jgi:hypothetical protein
MRLELLIANDWIDANNSKIERRKQQASEQQLLDLDSHTKYM